MKSGYIKIKIEVKWAKVYKNKEWLYFHRDTKHTWKWAEIEVYDKFGKHIWTSNVNNLNINYNNAVKWRNINIK